MKVKVIMTWVDGLQEESEQDPFYTVIDADTEAHLADLDTYEEVESFVARNHPAAERWVAADSSANAGKCAEIVRRIEALRKPYPRTWLPLMVRLLYADGNPELRPRVLAILQAMSSRSTSALD